MRSPAAGVAVIAFTIVVTAAAHAAHGHSATASTSAHAADGPPVAPREPVVDDYFGTKVTDDYRWMEDRHAPSFEQWCREESKAREERLTSLEAETTKVRQEMDKTYRLYIADQISPEGFGRTYRPLEERLKGMEEELPRLQGELDFLKVQYLGQDEILAETRDLYDRWPTLAAEEKRAIIEAIVQNIQVGKEVVEIELSPFPGSSEVAAERQHNINGLGPFHAWSRESMNGREGALKRPPYGDHASSCGVSPGCSH